MRRLRWEPPDSGRALPKHPYRDTAILYGVLALLVVVIAYATGGDVVKAVVTAIFVYILATLWSWRSWRNRLRKEALRKEQEERL